MATELEPLPDHPEDSIHGLVLDLVSYKLSSLSSGWSGAHANSFGSGSPWLRRGGVSTSTTAAGVESLDRSTGGTVASNGFRGVV
ncbi:hypothetical protein FWH09_03405 [Candidatus Saccharibacteria bacterium]|nr:hypothetical protein [Candidatus Saccharibacteria bacterium]